MLEKSWVPLIPLAVVLAPLHHALLVVSLFSVYSYRNDISPTASVSFLRFFCPGPPVWKPAVSSRRPFLHIHHSVKHNHLQLQKDTHPAFFLGGVKDRVDMLLLRKERKKYRAAKTNFLSVFAAEQCQSNEQMGWESSFWCKSTKSWLPALHLSWQEWNVVSLLFQYIKLKFKIMNLKLFRPNV